jgi:catechol 2,3-dioxygenase-like lactoylglutathione lyase family enzyme
MKARITVITLGVDDLERSVRFYPEGLGLKTEGIIGTDFEFGAARMWSAVLRFKHELVQSDLIPMRGQRSDNG